MKKRTYAFVIAVAAVAAAACDQDGVGAQASSLAADSPAFPPDNPATAEKVDLGRLLFWDPILSGDRDIACDVPNGSDRADLIEFLGSLGDGTYDATIPTEVPSGLRVGGNL